MLIGRVAGFNIRHILTTTNTAEISTPRSLITFKIGINYRFHVYTQSMSSIEDPYIYVK